jgi:hypothetical protein
MRIVGRAVSPVIVPCTLFAGYLVMLIVAFPRLISWENADSDVASAYVLADAVSQGHTGHVVMSTQGSWVPLWYGLATHGLGFHRVLWEISPALLTLAAALLIGWSVSRVASRAAGALAIALMLAASPTALFLFTAAFFHNTTIPGVALLGAFLVWIANGSRSGRGVVIAVVALSIVVGTFMASDELLAVVGLVPFAGVVLIHALRSRDHALARPVMGLTAGSVAIALLTSAVMRSAGFSTTTPTLQFTRRFLFTHARWFVDGVLRFGNGLSVAPHSSVRTPLVVAAGVVTLAAFAAALWLGARSLVAPQRRTESAAVTPGARELHAAFWASSMVCAAIAYVVTTVASYPTDRYFTVVVPALAATMPLLLRKRVTAWLIAAGASIFIVASIVSLAADNEQNVIVIRGADVAYAKQIESVVRARGLSVGYTGYWNAASLDWSTRERLHVYPITDRFGPTQPMYLARADAWYRPRPHTPSYLILAPGDFDLRDQLPSDLPRPRSQVRIGPITVAIYPDDLAAHLHPTNR